MSIYKTTAAAAFQLHSADFSEQAGFRGEERRVRWSVQSVLIKKLGSRELLV